MRILVLLLALVAGWNAHAVEFTNLTLYPVNHPECKGFVVIQEECRQYRLYCVSPDNELQVIAHPPSELYPCTIQYILQSPDREKVLILSTDEGRPGIAVYKVSDIVSHRKASREGEQSESHGGNDVPVLPSLGELGSCDRPEWVSNTVITFMAKGVTFHILDNEPTAWEARENADDAWYKWRWDIANKTIVRVHK